MSPCSALSSQQQTGASASSRPASVDPEEKQCPEICLALLKIAACYKEGELGSLCALTAPHSSLAADLGVPPALPSL